jgi:hypothetical protein
VLAPSLLNLALNLNLPLFIGYKPRLRVRLRLREMRARAVPTWNGALESAPNRQPEKATLRVVWEQETEGTIRLLTSAATSLQCRQLFGFVPPGCVWVRGSNKRSS